MWKGNEREVASIVIRNLQSEKYKGKNYLFLQPFDLTQVPGYLDVVSRPLDLQTVSSNLQNEKYPDATSFWKDVAAVFENAITYHNDKPTKWIAKMAKDMLKTMNKERRNAEKPKTESQKKVKLLLKPKAASALKSEGSGQLATRAEEEEIVPPPAKKTKLSLKLKLSSSSTAGNLTAASTSPSSAPTSTKSTASKKSKEKTKLKLSTSAAAVTAAPKIRLSLKPKTEDSPKVKPNAVSRGKELPQAVLEQKQQQKEAQKKDSTQQKKEKQTALKKSTKKKTTKRTKTPPASASSGGSSSGMTAAQRQQCSKILLGLKRRQTKTVAWFLQPVSDKALLPDYRSKIKNPMDLTTLQNKLEKGSSKYAPKDFVLDLRRIFANCLKFNTSIKDSLRPVAVQVLETAESLVRFFLPSQQPLLFCWKLCIEILDSLYNLQNSDKQPTALYFLYPVSYYCGGKFPADYLQLIKKPMDFGTITANLLEGRYQIVEDFSADCKLVISNCRTYYSGRTDGTVYLEQAGRLDEYLTRQLDQLSRYAKSFKGTQDRTKAFTATIVTRPTPALLAGVLAELRTLKYTDKATKITEPAMGPFERPVSAVAFPDYASFVSEPMDLATVDRKINSDSYVSPEDFEYDVSLIFRNCEVYNSQRGGDHLVAMAKYASRQFRRIFYAKCKFLDDPSVVPPPDDESTQLESPTQGAPKKIKISAGGTSKGKTAPRISITASQVSSASIDAAKATSKSPKTVVSATQKNNAGAPPKSNQPVPLHIAIARVKEAFPLRRTVKSLQSWEADCARYFKELMRHPWISAARPKFIFHVPVPTLFPELREAYASKIRKPMDLTTVECTLLAVGNRYSGPEDFVRDIALVFANAVRFNKDGMTIGDPLSTAYYDASVHLLRYSRWLCMELLSSYIDEDSDHVDEPGENDLPPFEWRLTAGNRKKAREEMEALVLKEPIERSLEGDRYTWSEAEGEKLLKALRHQSDLRHMTFFISANYPADYTAFIAKPMDWEKVQRKLKKRQYDTFNDIIEDLRLIFSNALKYNSRLRGTDTINARAYDSALIMQKKLEAAINKLLISASDRIERERIDHANAEREIEAAERAEEAKIREAWKKDNKDGTSPPPSQSDIAQKIRSVRRAVKQREITDFEMPFFDEEDNGQHASSYFEVVKLQKSIYEKQTEELSKLRDAAKRLSTGVFERLFQRRKAQEWVSSEFDEILSSSSKHAGTENVSSSANDTNTELCKEEEPSSGSLALPELKRKGRQKLHLQLAIPAVKKKKPVKRKRKLLDF